MVRIIVWARKMKGFGNAPLQRSAIWGLMALTLLLTLTGCPAPQISAPQRSAPLNRTALRSPQTGTCECPYDKAASGKQCGNSSSYSRGGGDRPACYAGEQPQTAQVPPQTAPIPAPSSNPHLMMGNPTNATTNASQKDNYLMVKEQYALSYNRDKGTANWVSWQSNKSWIGSVDRSNDFRPDVTLPAGFYQVRPNDYTNTGYDRGHIVPSGDRTNAKADNSATFLMINMLPQTPQLNREVWREFEEYCRQLVAQGKELYIVAGPYGKKGAIANGKVTVPTDNWKVILVLDKPGSGLGGVTAQTQTIAVWMPNDKAIGNTDWKNYIVSVDDVEAKTGYDFFSSVPPTVQKVIEAKRYSP